jgi:hypothetical protein
VTLPLSLVLMFLAASLGVAASYAIWKDLRQRDTFRTRRRMESEFSKPEPKPATRTSLFKSVSQFDLREIAADRLPDLDAPLPEPVHLDWRTRLQTMPAQSGLPLTLPQLAYVSMGTALVGGVAAEQPPPRSARRPWTCSSSAWRAASV